MVDSRCGNHLACFLVEVATSDFIVMVKLNDTYNYLLILTISLMAATFEATHALALIV